MRTYWLNAIAIFVSVTAIVVVATSSDTTRFRSDSATDARSIAIATTRLAELDERLTALERAMSETSDGDNGPTEKATSHGVEELERRVISLERRSREMYEKAEKAQPRWTEAERKRREAFIATAVHRYRQRFLDPGLNLYDRLAALRILRKLAPHRESLDAVVVETATELLRKPQDKATYKRLLRGIRGGSDPRLASEIVKLLASHSEASVREEAVMALRHMASIPDVQRALQKAAKTDPDAEVREKAAKPLTE